MHNKEVDKIVLLLNSDDHENVWLGFQFMETLGLSEEVLIKYASLNNVTIKRQGSVIKASGQINKKIANLLSKLSLNSVAYYSEKVYKKVSKYTYSFLGMLIDSEHKKCLKQNSVTFSLEAKRGFVHISLNSIFKRCKEIEIRKPILEKIPTMKAYKEDKVQCTLQLINEQEYLFEFRSSIQV